MAGAVTPEHAFGQTQPTEQVIAQAPLPMIDSVPP
jgi:hypothetical protein